MTNETTNKLTDLGEDITNKEYYKQNGDPIKVPMPSDKEHIKKKGVNALNYGILTYFSNYQDTHESEIDDYDTHRYIYEEGIIKDKELIEQYSNTKINTFIRNARKLQKLTDGEFVTVDNVGGRTVYRLNKGGKYVLIERRILEVLISCTNSEVIKMYMFFKWRCGEKGDIVSRKEIASYIGYSVKSCATLDKISNDIETFLVKLGLIRKENIVLPSTEGKQYNKACFYQVVSYEEWIDFWNNGKNAVDFRDK